MVFFKKPYKKLLLILVNSYNGFFKKPYKNVVGFSYLLVLVITKTIKTFEN